MLVSTENLQSTDFSSKISIFDCFASIYFSGADSLEYLSVDGLKRAVQYNMKSKNRAESGHCTACLTGEYPGGLPEELSW